VAIDHDLSIFTGQDEEVAGAIVEAKQPNIAVAVGERLTNPQGCLGLAIGGLNGLVSSRGGVLSILPLGSLTNS